MALLNLFYLCIVSRGIVLQHALVELVHACCSFSSINECPGNKEVSPSDAAYILKKGAGVLIIEDAHMVLNSEVVL